MDGLVRAFEQLSEHEIIRAKQRGLTMVVRSSAEFVEQLQALPEPWVVKSITYQQKRFIVRLVRFEF